jgi:hypothetical protein
METRGVPLVTSIRVQFDRFLAPASTVRQAICVQSCTVGPSAQCDGQCLGGLSPEYDPIDRVVVWKNVQLAAGLRYNVRLVVPTSDDDVNGIRAIDGAPLAKEYTFAFTAGDPSKMAPDPDAIKPELAAAETVVTQRAAINFCSTSPLCPVPTSKCTTPGTDLLIQSPQFFLQNSCAAGGNCHGVPQPGQKGPAGSVLSFTDADGGIAAAVNRLVLQSTVATENAVAADPATARRGPLDVFGVNMPYFDAKNPGNSFLLYKVILGMGPRCGPQQESANPAYDCMAALAPLATDEFLCRDIQCKPDAGGDRPQVDGGPPAVAGQPAPPLVPGWVPDDRWKPAAAGEYARLRTRIRGDGMPPPTLPAPTSYQNARDLSAWIAAGATTTCPATP